MLRNISTFFYIYRNLESDRGTLQVNGGKNGLIIKWCRYNWPFIWEGKIYLSTFYTQKTNYRLIEDLTVVFVLGTLQSRYFELKNYISKIINIKNNFECFAKLARKK